MCEHETQNVNFYTTKNQIVVRKLPNKGLSVFDELLTQIFATRCKAMLPICFMCKI